MNAVSSRHSHHNVSRPNPAKQEIYETRPTGFLFVLRKNSVLSRRLLPVLFRVFFFFFTYFHCPRFSITKRNDLAKRRTPFALARHAIALVRQRLVPKLFPAQSCVRTKRFCAIPSRTDNVLVLYYTVIAARNVRTTSLLTRRIVGVNTVNYANVQRRLSGNGYDGNSTTDELRATVSALSVSTGFRARARKQKNKITKRMLMIAELTEKNFKLKQ